jgi:DNA repair exonuclease SbcCD ATPase subunit
MGTIVLLDDAGKVSQVLDAKMALASPRAKVDKRYSPVWEGILNLRRPEAGEDAKAYRAECSAVVTDWYKRYEATTGHKVLRVDVHLDEGHMVEGEAVLNAHAHVIADRTNDLGRVIKLSPKQLRELQTMTAEITQLERGKSSFETGRKHINHQAYKHLAEQGRLETQQVKTQLDKSQSDLTRQRKLSKEWSDSDLAKVKDLKAQLDGEPARLEAALKAQEVQLKAQYQLDREALKATGEAKQKDYQALKAAHEAALADLAKAQGQAAKVPELVTQATGLQAEIDRLNEQYRLDRESLKASGTAKQADYQALKKAHEADLVKVKKELTEAQAEAAKVPSLEAAISTFKNEAVGFREHITKTKNDLDKAQAEAAKVPALVAQAVQAQTQIAQLAPLAEQVPELKKTLAEAKTEAGKVPDLVATVTLKTAEINRLTPLAEKVPGLEAQVKAQADQIAQIKAQYQLDREALKASGTATQQAYMALKIVYEAALVDLKTAQAEAAKVPALETKITQQAEAFDKLKTDAMAVITPLRTQIIQLETAKLEADKTRFEDMAKAYQEGKAAGIAAHLIVPGAAPAPVIGPNERARLRALEATRTASEAPKRPEVPIPPPTPQKSLVERLGESWEAMLGWIKSIGAEQEPVTASSRHDGPVKHLDDLHCVQKTGKRYAIHKLADLDNVPALDDPQMTIQYRDGKGTVKGRLGKPGVQI